jgi:hypothetical protein
LSCEGIGLAASKHVTQNPCTLDGRQCNAALDDSSQCINHYPPDQCKALCDATGGVGGASGLSVNATAAGRSCAAFVTSTANESCCLFSWLTLFVASNVSGPGALVADPSATLHWQVNATEPSSGGAVTTQPSVCPSLQSGGTGLAALPPLATKALSVGGAFVVGEFVHRDGRTAVMVQNFNLLLSAMVRSHSLSSPHPLSTCLVLALPVSIML